MRFEVFNGYVCEMHFIENCAEGCTVVKHNADGFEVPV